MRYNSLSKVEVSDAAMTPINKKARINLVKLEDEYETEYTCLIMG